MSKPTRRTQIDNQECGFYQLYENGKALGRVSFDTLAAAPELLDILKDASCTILSVEGSEMEYVAATALAALLKRIDAAIAKAEGRGGAE